MWTDEKVFEYRVESKSFVFRIKNAKSGIFPCIMASMQEVKAVAQDDKYRKRLFELEAAVNKVRNGKKCVFL
jgi:hypothetical protein